MNLVQKVLSLVLYIGNAKKQVLLFICGYYEAHSFLIIGFSAVTKDQLNNVTCFSHTFVEHIW